MALNYENILALAELAPSGDNCRPWRFERRSSGEIIIYHDDERARHVLNPRGHASMLSLGGVLESISIAASQQQHRIEFELGEMKLGQSAPWAVVRFTSDTAVQVDSLATIIEKRCTDRRLYKGGNLSSAMWKAVEAEAHNFKNISLHYCKDYSPEWLKYLNECEGYLVDHPAAMRDLLPWVRFSPQEERENIGGMTWQKLGVSYLDSRSMLLMRRNIGWLKVFRLFGMRSQVQALARRQLRSAAGLVLLTVKSREVSEVVGAGRAGFRAWVRLNGSGFAVQPLTIPALNVYYQKFGFLSLDIRPHYHQLFAGGREVFARQFSLAADEIPIWLFRTGVAPD